MLHWPENATEYKYIDSELPKNATEYDHIHANVQQIYKANKYWMTWQRLSHSNFIANACTATSHRLQLFQEGKETGTHLSSVRCHRLSSAQKQPCSMFQHEERQSLFVLDKQLSHSSLITGLSSGSLLLMKAHFCYYFQGCRSPGKDLMWHNIARKVMKHYSDVMISAAASPNHQCLDC